MDKRIWINMHDRCFNQKHRSYHRYGGRGITVCPRWLYGENGISGFECFSADMGEQPSGHELDRWPDNNGNYEPGNCRWATPKQNSNNRSNNVMISHNGETHNLTEWAEKLGIKRGTLWHRYKVLGMPLERALKAENYSLGRRNRKPANVKLTAAAAKEICRRYRNGECKFALGLEFNVNHNTVWKIGTGRTWRVETQQVRDFTVSRRRWTKGDVR